MAIPGCLDFINLASEEDPHLASLRLHLFLKPLPYGSVGLSQHPGYLSLNLLESHGLSPDLRQLPRQGPMAEGRSL